MCLIVAAAAAIPFALLRNGSTPPPGKTSASSPAATGSASPGSQTSPAIAQNSGSASSSGNAVSAGQPAPYSLAGSNLRSAYPGAFISSLAFSPAGATLAIADPGPRAGAGTCLWRIATAACTTFKTNAYAVAFSHDGTVLATSGELAFSGQSQATVSGVTRLWNAATGKQLGLVTNPDSKGALSGAFSPDGKTLAVADRNGKVYLWDAASGQAAGTLTDPVSKGVNSVAFSPDGALLAAADANGFCYLWDVASGQVKVVLADPASKGVNSVAFSPDGKSVAVGDLNGRGYLWNVATGTGPPPWMTPPLSGRFPWRSAQTAGRWRSATSAAAAGLWDVATPS